MRVTATDAERQTPRQRLALEYTRAAMADSNRVSDDLFARLNSAFTDAEIVEITFLIGNINCLNLFNNCLRVMYHGECDASQPALGHDGRPMSEA